MWFKTHRQLRAENAALRARIVDLEAALFQVQMFEKIAADKLTLWVRKHDDLLVQHKILQQII